MGQKSSIEWTDRTWNPITGCTKVSPGCANCYAERITERFHGAGSFAEVVLHPERLHQPLHWKEPSRIFVNSMSDLFHEDVPSEFIGHVFAVMALARKHTFQILTKRPERMRREIRSLENVALEADCTWPIPNVFLGVSVENQHFADERIPILLETPAAVRFISAEPLLGAVDLRNSRGKDFCQQWRTSSGVVIPRAINWVICGGESGPGARPMDIAWARSLRDQCKAAGVAFFMKQLGGASDKRSRLGDLPEDLRIREWPAVQRNLATER